MPQYDKSALSNLAKAFTRTLRTRRKAIATGKVKTSSNIVRVTRQLKRASAFKAAMEHVNYHMPNARRKVRRKKAMDLARTIMYRMNREVAR